MNNGLNYREVIAEYNTVLKQEIATLEDKIEINQRSVLTYGKLILNRSSEYRRNRVADYIAEVLSDDTKEFNRTRLQRAYVGLDLTDILYPKDKTEANRVLTAFFGQFKEAGYILTESKEELENIKLQKLDDTIIGLLFREYSKEMGRQMLLNGTTYPLGHGLTLNIKSKHREGRVKIGKSRQKPDWGKSFKLLQILLEDINPDLLERYKTKQINKAQLIYDSKPYMYNAKDNPKAPKWLVYDDKDFDFWLVLRTYSSKLKNKDYYSVTPVNFVANETSSQSDFLKEVTNINDIINTSQLGFRDKLVMLEKYDISHCLTHYSDGL